MTAVDLTLIVVNYNTAHLLAEMFAAVDAAAQGLVIQTIIVDNASRDGSAALIRERYPQVELIENTTNVGFGRANNQAIPLMRGDHVLLLNTDAFVSPDTLVKTLAYLREHPRCGVLGVRLVGRDGAQQPSCRYFPTPANTFLMRTGLSRFVPWVRAIDDPRWDPGVSCDCDWVPGCYYLMPREVVDRVGLFDPRYFLYSEEVDHCRRVKRAGFTVHYFADTAVVHIGGESARSDNAVTAAGSQISVLQIESELLYFRKHHGLAGVLASLALTTVADLLLALKSLVKWARPPMTLSHLQHLAAVFRLSRRTAFGRLPTR